MSAADAGSFQRTHNKAAKVDDDDDDDVGAARSSADVSATLRNVDLLNDNEASASNVNPHSTVLFDTEIYSVSNSERQNYINPSSFTKRRKPPEYVGYVVNVDSNVDAQGQSAKSEEFLGNVSGADNAGGRKTNVITLPVPDKVDGHGWKADEDGVWKEACRELNCISGSTCVPDALRGGRPRCQCPLGTDGHRCERRTSAVKIKLSLDQYTNVIYIRTPAYIFLEMLSHYNLRGTTAV